MTTYMAYLPPEAGNREPAQDFKLLPDAKRPLALIYITVTFAIILLAYWQPGAPVLLLSAIPGFYLLLEGSELIRSKYERDGWRYVGIVEGNNVKEAQIRFSMNYDFDLFSKVTPQIIQSKPERPLFQTSSNDNPGLFPE